MKLFLILFLLVCFNSKAQTVIDYANYTGSGCVFTSSTDVPATINGTSGNIKHQTSVGEVDYGTTTNVLYFQSNSTNSVGSEYKIEYTFKPNYSYSIVVNTRSINNSGATPYLRLKITNSASSSAICSGPQTIDGTISGTLIVSKVIPNGNFADQTFTFNSLSGGSNYPYITLANIPSANGGVQTIEISKITITETAPPVSFTLPSTTPVPCGSTSPVTFTVTNVNNTPNVTDYTWNLGATPNGWLLSNGSQAPATVSTGTTNNITLTPNCGSTLSNIGATVTAGGNQYNTNQSTINVTAPSLSITGNSAFCSGNPTYSVTGLPCNASVTWSASPSGAVSLSCTSCNSTTLTKTGDGNVTLTATVTSPTCSNLTPPTKTIVVGNAFPQGTTYATSNYSYYSGTLLSSYSFFLPANDWGYATFNITDANYTSLSWSAINVPSGSATWSYSGTGNRQLSINIKAIGSAYNTNTCTIRLSAQGPCGSYTQDFSASAVVRGWGFMVSPNPASSEITVSTTNAQGKSSPRIYGIKILDQSGTVRKSFEYKQGVSSARIPIAELKQGTYMISVFDGKEWSSKAVIIQK